MAQGVDSTKTEARPSHEALENKPGSLTQENQTEQQKIDQAAMQGAKRAENRIKANEDSTPGDSLFTK